jgi:molybdenum cofactor biosynthesis enzyme MoaA
MNVQHLEAELDSKFDIVCFYDLADVMITHGEIFKIFKKYYQAEYQPNERLVFYTSDDPSQLVFDHLQRAATKIDISNSFIILCSPYNIEFAIKTANAKYGNDNFTMTWYPCTLTPTKNINSDKIYPFDTFCPLPFGSLTIAGPAQAAMPCCKYKKFIGPFDNNTFFNEQMTELRNDIKNNRRHKDCSVCWHAEDVGQTSMRQHFINKYIDQCDQEWVDDPRIRDLTIKPNTLCNFDCRICSPEASSKIAVEELKFSTDPYEQQKLKKMTNWALSDQYHHTAYKILHLSSDLTYLHILGGEPFLWRDLDYLLDKLICLDLAKNIQIEFNTNCSIYPKKIITKLLKFKSVEILISIDDINERFEIQRGGSWNQVSRNIQAFKNLKSPTFKVKVAPTVNIQNLLYLDQLVNFCDNLDLEIVWWFLESPQYLSIDFITTAAKKIAYQKYINHSEPQLQAIAQRVHQSRPINDNLFLTYMKKIDQRRGQDSSVVLKEIFNAMSSLDVSSISEQL